jgi:hypothetical protein
VTDKLRDLMQRCMPYVRKAPWGEGLHAQQSWNCRHGLVVMVYWVVGACEEASWKGSKEGLPPLPPSQTPAMQESRGGLVVASKASLHKGASCWHL